MTKQLSNDFSIVCGTMTKISDVASDLYNTHKKFNNTVKSHKWDRMQDSYAALNQTMVTWGKKIRLTRKMPKKAE